MQAQTQRTHPGARLFKVVTLTVYRTHQLIEACSEAEALGVANQTTQSGSSLIDQKSVVTVTGARGGICYD